MSQRKWLANGPQATEPYVVGTCEVGIGTFGTVTSCTVTREHDQIEVKDCCGDNIAVLLKNSRHTMQLSAIFAKSASVPTDGQAITFPGAIVAVVGSILKWSVKWENENLRMIDIEATHWSSIGTPTVSTFNCP